MKKLFKIYLKRIFFIQTKKKAKKKARKKVKKKVKKPDKKLKFNSYIFKKRVKQFNVSLFQ